jgi:hypothetical protein
MLEVQSQENMPKEANYIYYQKVISLINCGNTQSSFSFSFFVMGIFDGPITNKFNQALKSTKIPISYSHFLGYFK